MVMNDNMLIDRRCSSGWQGWNHGYYDGGRVFVLSAMCASILSQLYWTTRPFPCYNRSSAEVEVMEQCIWAKY